jgi:ABC-2 type transport system ATP-binding protein
MIREEIAVSVSHVSKDFLLPHERTNSLKSAFINALRPKNKKIDVQHALQDISFEIKTGEFFGICGRNGSGKSTMLKILANIYQPTKGRIKISGRLVPFIELGVGFNAELTGRENVYLNGAMLGFSRKEIDKMYNDIVAFAELERFMDQKLKNYSSGMQVRLAFSMATRAEADVLLVDEVLAVGDADFQRKCFDYFRKLKRDKKTVVFVSHDMGAVREYCDRAVLIEDSKLVMEGAANAVADEYTRLFIPKDTSTDTQQLDRIGNGKVRFEKITVPKRITADDKKVSLTFSFVAKQAVGEMRVGFKITDPMEKPLMGFNNELANKTIPGMKKWEKMEATFTFDNLLNEGVYPLDVVLESAQGETYDWWVRVRELSVYKEKKTGYPIEPPIELDLSRG